MRLPRALEFPSVIVVTGVLTFTGVSALQAAVNPPLYERVQKALAEAGDFEAEDFDYSDTASDLRAVFFPEAPQPPALLAASESTPLEAARQEAPDLASTGPAAPEMSTIGSSPAVVESAVQGGLPPAAQAGVAARGPAAPVAAPGQSQAPVGQNTVPAPAPQHAAPPAKAAPTPVSGMDYVWDQVFGDGTYAKPAAPAKANPPAGSKSQGANNAAVCPPGQAKKGNC